MGNRVRYTQANVTPTAGNDIMTYVSAANRRARLVEAGVSGRHTASTPQEVQVGRSTGGTTGGGAVTASKHTHTDQPTAVGVVNTTWAAQPTLDTNPIVLGFNSLGGWNRWPGTQAIPAQIEARNGENISMRASAGITFQPLSAYMVIEED